MAIRAVEHPKVIYLIERALQPEPPTAMDKVKKIAGTMLAILGLAILLCSAIALAGHAFGTATVAAETIHTFFMTGIVSVISGFHLAKSGPSEASSEIAAGPLSVTI